MERLKISTPRMNIRYVFLIISICIALTIPIQIFKIIQSDGTVSILSVISPIVGASIFYYFFIKNKYQLRFEFDNQFLYKAGGELDEKIALENIYEIEKPILQMGGSTNNWIIRYKNASGNSNDIKIVTSFRRQNFDKFIKAVKSKNAKVKVLTIF